MESFISIFKFYNKNKFLNLEYKDFTDSAKIYSVSIYVNLLETAS